MRYQSVVKPWAHQAKALRRLWKQGSTLLWADVGTGKTKIAVDYGLARYKAGQVRRVLVVGPLSSMGVWEDEINKHARGPLYMRSRNDVNQLSDFVPITHEARQFKGLSVLVVTYQTLVRYVKLFADSYQPDLLIIDESQYIRNYSAQRTRRTLAVARSAKYVVELSGTPCPNGYEELYWQVKAIHPSVFPPTIQAFRERYCRLGGYMGQEIIGYQNKKDLARRLSKVAIRIPKSVLELPETIDQRIPVKLDATSRKVYTDMERDLVTHLQSGEKIDASNQLVLLTRLNQITGGVFNGERIGKQPKLQVLAELLTLETGKVVVFAHFVQEITEICRVLDENKISHRSITGGVSGSKRTAIIKEFQTQKQPKVLVCQTTAGGIAVTLTAASVSIFYGLTHNAEAYEQARGRIERGGQTQSCRFLHLVAQDTVDETIYDALRQKMSQQAVLGEIVRRYSRG